ncbi:hypothetical protein [Corynebacterium argentoratense]|uniref:hypothetical protein n=1 Tax=Corynebacterium argentoratense TaxID=42817 RepID=UPI001F17350B|nr:hypothetical protein [Corynebacterium argentoratense]MCF1712656.1 hypothetical protein [Corynebacterium argentoratense]
MGLINALVSPLGLALALPDTLPLPKDNTGALAVFLIIATLGIAIGSVAYA